MTKLFAYHVFAHKSGRYQTVSTIGVGPKDVQSLEQFFFGQTNDADYLESLRSEPGIVWRRIGARFALTRVTQGGVDSDGRATLRFETILEAEQEARLAENVAGYVLAMWEFTNQGVMVNDTSVTRMLPLDPKRISGVVLAAREGKRVLRPAKPFSLRDISIIVNSCAQEKGFSLCFKSLNDRAPLQVNLVSRNIEERIMAKPQKSIENRLPRASSTPRPRRATAASNTLVLILISVILIIQTIIVLGASRGSTNGESSDMQDNIISQVKETAREQTSKLEQLSTTIEDAIDTSTTEHTKSAAELGRSTVAVINDLRKAVEDNKAALNKLNDDLDSIKQSVEMIERIDDLATRMDVSEIRTELDKISASTAMILTEMKEGNIRTGQFDSNKADER